MEIFYRTGKFEKRAYLINFNLWLKIVNHIYDWYALMYVHDIPISLLTRNVRIGLKVLTCTYLLVALATKKKGFILLNFFG